jgi:hypothetical protein
MALVKSVDLREHITSIAAMPFTPWVNDAVYLEDQSKLAIACDDRR